MVCPRQRQAGNEQTDHEGVVVTRPDQKEQNERIEESEGEGRTRITIRTARQRGKKHCRERDADHSEKA